ncbi:hypothetical protein [Sphingomonas sp.]|uniref:hypothetical protein n=1 Tax=Sphingomonas sp. TaxID=28214 RepID=UPI0035C80783
MRSIAFLAAALAGLASPALAQRGGDWFAAADADRDGAVSRAEFVRYRDANFGRLDRNGDGVVSPADFPRLASLRPEAFARLTEALGGADRNGDGAISRTELAQAPPVMFDRTDANRDGRVTQAEYDAGRARMRDAIQQSRN